MSKQHNIMVVDDEENILRAIRRLFAAEPDWHVETYSNPEDALRRAQTSLWDVVLSDCNMPGMDGIEFLQAMKDVQPDCIRIMLTGMVNIDTLVSAINSASAFRFYPKPWHDEQLIQGVKEGIALREILVENRMLAEKVRDQEAQLQHLLQYAG